MAQTVSLGSIRAKHWKSTIYGIGGAGKSIMAAAAGAKNGMRTWYFDIDNGLESVAAHFTRYGLSDAHLTICQVKNTNDLLGGLAQLEREMAKYKDGLLVFDTSSEMQRMLMRDLLAAKNKKQAEQQDWGDVLKIMEDLAVKTRGPAFPMHTLWLAHDMYKGDEFVKTAKWRPAYEGSFRYTYLRHFGIVGRLVVSHAKGEQANSVKVVRAIDFRPSPTTDTKDRSGALAGWEHPDFAAILTKALAAAKPGNGREETYTTTAGDAERPTVVTDMPADAEGDEAEGNQTVG